MLTQTHITRIASEAIEYGKTGKAITIFVNSRIHNLTDRARIFSRIASLMKTNYHDKPCDRCSAKVITRQILSPIDNKPKHLCYDCYDK